MDKIDGIEDVLKENAMVRELLERRQKEINGLQTEKENLLDAVIKIEAENQQLRKALKAKELCPIFCPICRGRS